MVILVVDDNPGERDLLAQIITGWGYKVLTASSGKEALEILSSLHEVILVADWKMPEMDGLELCQRVGENFPGLNFYRILITSAPEEADVTQALSWAAEAFLFKKLKKPVDGSELQLSILVGQRILKRFSKERTDGVTKIWKREEIERRLEAELDRARREETNLGLIFIDLDHLREINNNYGHAAGDLVLRQVVKRIIHSIRSYDHAGRVGGDEFVVVSPGCLEKDLENSAKRIKQAVEDEPVKLDSGEKITATISVGVAVSTPQSFLSAKELYDMADHCLYEAKNKGRNRVEVAFSSKR